MATDWFVGREIGAALALLVSSWPVGIGIGTVLPWLATTFSVYQHFSVQLRRRPQSWYWSPRSIALRKKAGGRTELSPFVAREGIGVIGGGCLGVVQCRLHHCPELHAVFVERTGSICKGRRHCYEPCFLDADKHNDFGRYSARSDRARHSADD